MKEKLSVEVISADANADLLANVPHDRMEDLAVVYRFVMESSEDGRASILVTNNLMDRMGVSHEQLRADALENSPEIRPVVIMGMNEVMKEMIDPEVYEMFGIPDDAEETMYVATVPDKNSGAGVIAYQDFMDQAAERVGGDFFVLPSSINEILLVPDNGDMTADALRDMVKDVNAKEVSPEERLSDNVYHYDSKDHVFELAEKFEARQQEKKTEIDEKSEEKGSVLKDLKDKQKEAAAKPPVKDAAEKAAKSKGYKTTSTKKSVLKYVTDDVNLDDGQGALSVTIPHSSLQTVKYVYDEQNQVYKRYARNKAQTDWDTGNSITTKNIIITMCDNYTLEDSENKGRQGLKNIGTFNGYYITNGKAIKIKCIKESRNAQTKYQDLQGNEIKVNDGNTWINICPTNAKIVIEGPATETGVDTTNNV